MKHKGKALGAAAAMLGKTLMVVVLFAGVTAFLWPKNFLVAAGISGLGLLFSLFTLWFFRDPDPVVPVDPRLVVAPGHGKVDVIDETDEPNVMGGRCRRVSIFLSVFDVHVQQSPVEGRLTYLRHTPGLFLNALKTESAAHNENVLLGFETGGGAGVKVGVRLITGLIARRIIPWVETGDVMAKGERISLIQFGSRVNLYLPLNAEITVKLGDRVVGGESVVAKL
ncbi:MAG TPA: phosphatidylserine decarboxylase [Candidatus Limnocylindria bacterium]|nr:phosphatidylserine decarboxylase [Candidatus Limnocylindria bacterium]